MRGAPIDSLDWIPIKLLSVGTTAAAGSSTDYAKISHTTAQRAVCVCRDFIEFDFEAIFIEAHKLICPISKKLHYLSANGLDQ